MTTPEILISEVGPRDGLQSVKATMPTADKLRWISALAVFGAAPMFVYLLHLYVLKLLYLMGVALFGLNHGAYFGFDHISAVWVTAIVLAVALYKPVRWFAALKGRRRDIRWLKYF